MAIHLCLEEISVLEIEAADTAIIASILSRPQLMRLNSGLHNRDFLKLILDRGLMTSDRLFACQENGNGYYLGLILIESRMILGEQTTVLSFAFDRCVAGRARAIEGIAALRQAIDLNGSVCLIGPSMANSERAAKALGYLPANEFVLDNIPYKVLRLMERRLSSS